MGLGSKVLLACQAEVVVGVIGVKGVIGVEVAPEILLPHELDALESILDVEIELQFG